MLLCNGEPVNLKAPSSSTAKFVVAKIKELSALDFPIRFNLPKENSSMVEEYNQQSKTSRPILERAQGVRILLSNNYRNPKGYLEKWTYFTDVKESEKGVKSYFPRYYQLKGVNIFTERDKELLFYLIYISGSCEDIEGITSQNPAKKRTYMILEDRNREARKYGEKIRRQLEVSNILYDPDKLSDDELRILAKSYYIQGVDGIKELDVLRKSISEIVIKSNDSKSVDKFLEKTKMKDKTIIQALITEAIDKKVIFNKSLSSGRKTWIFLNEDGTTGNDIMECLPSDGIKRVLANELLGNNKLLETLKLEVESRK